jgi:hypothetical protein
VGKDNGRPHSVREPSSVAPLPSESYLPIFLPSNLYKFKNTTKIGIFYSFSGQKVKKIDKYFLKNSKWMHSD